MVHHDSTVVEYDSFESQLDLKAVSFFLEPSMVDADLKNIAAAHQN